MLTAVEELGVTVVFVTGRPVRWMHALWEHVGDHGLAICSNGGIVYDVHARAVRSCRPIPVETGLHVARLMREGIPGTTFALEKTTGFGREPRFMERHDLPGSSRWARSRRSSTTGPSSCWPGTRSGTPRSSGPRPSGSSATW